MKINALSKTYGTRKVLDTPAFELREGRVTALIGSNGSGKSTLAAILAGVAAADGGAKAFERYVDTAYMPQKSFAFRMSGQRNLRLTGASAAEAEAILRELGLADIGRKSAKGYSGGELARLALGRVLIRRHELLVLDEPCAGMDMESTLLAERLISGYCAETGAAVLIITHSLAQARRMAHEAVFLKNGQLWECGAAEKLLYAPDRKETAGFLEFYGK